MSISSEKYMMIQNKHNNFSLCIINPVFGVNIFIDFQTSNTLITQMDLDEHIQPHSPQISCGAHLLNTPSLVTPKPQVVFTY